MDEIHQIGVEAYKWLNDKPPSQRSLSHLCEHPKYDILRNNICEGWNSVWSKKGKKAIMFMMVTIKENLVAIMYGLMQ